MENQDKINTVPVVTAGTIHPYESPLLTTLTLLKQASSEWYQVSAVFETIPRLARSRIKQMCKVNFLVKCKKRVTVRFDRLVFSGRVCTGIVITTKG